MTSDKTVYFVEKNVFSCKCINLSSEKLLSFKSARLFREELKTYNFSYELVCEHYQQAINVTLPFARNGDKLHRRNNTIVVITAF